MFREALLTVWILTGVAYLLMALLPRKRQAPIVMAWAMAHLSYCHVLRLLDDKDWPLDITGCFTILQVCKLSALAYCYSDGKVASE